MQILSNEKQHLIYKTSSFSHFQEIQETLQDFIFVLFFFHWTRFQWTLWAGPQLGASNFFPKALKYTLSAKSQVLPLLS